MVDFLGSTTVIPGSPARLPMDGTAVCDMVVHYTHLPASDTSRHIAEPVIVSDLFVLVPGERFTCLGSIELHSLGFLFRMA